MGDVDNGMIFTGMRLSRGMSWMAVADRVTIIGM